MVRRRKPHLQKKRVPGTVPGTLVPPEGASAPRITVIAYDEHEITEHVIDNPADVQKFMTEGKTVWIDVDGLGSVETLRAFGKMFNLHVLTLEDVLNLNHRSKAETFRDYIFVVTRMATIQNDVLDLEQISLFIGRNYVLTFQERPGGDCLGPVRTRLRQNIGPYIRRRGADYLAYALIDAIIDAYFPVIEHYSDRLDALEDKVIGDPQREIIPVLHDFKRDLQSMRHDLWPMREMVNALRADHDFIQEETRPFLRDCSDHVIQILDILETYRERSASLVDIYLSSISNKMNEVMQVLTIIATIFMPLSFIASLYGMNFDTSSPYNMPELHWRYGYLFSLGLMGVVAAGLLYFFYRRGWLGKRR